MALAPNSVSRFPDVPRAPGVPPVLRQIGAIENKVVAIVSDAVSILKLFGIGAGPQWGIFDQRGAPVLLGDSVVAVDYRKEYRISDYPVEQGGFASYNKVQQPFDVRVSFAVAGKLDLISSLISGGAIGSMITTMITGKSPTQARRGRFLEDLEAALASLYLFDVVTPEATYHSLNLVHCDYRREARNGATMLTIDVWCQEVRAIATAVYSQTKTPEASPKKDSGAVQPKTPAELPMQPVAPSAPSSNVAGVPGAPGTQSGAQPTPPGQGAGTSFSGGTANLSGGTTSATGQTMAPNLGPDSVAPMPAPQYGPPVATTDYSGASQAGLMQLQ
jgi:hypothetical protein